MSQLKAVWERFFYAPELVASAVAWRIALSAWTLLFFLPRLPYLEELYSATAVHTPHPLLRWVGMPTLPMWGLWLLMASTGLCLVLLMLGRAPRVLHLLLLPQLGYLFGFDLSLLRGYGELAFYQWLILWLLPYDRLRDEAQALEQAPRWGLQLARLQLSSVYAFTLGAKLVGGAGWLDGKTLYYTLKGQDYGQFLLSSLWLPSMGQAQVFGLLTLLGEAFVAVGLFFERTRRLAMLTCLLLHLGMGLMLRVSVLFPLLMWAHMVLFISPSEWRRLLERPSSEVGEAQALGAPIKTPSE